MHISEKKINRISRQIAETLIKDTTLRKMADQATMEAEIKAVIMADLKEEEAIEEKARKLLEAHSNRISMTGMDYQELLRKAIRQIAREQNFTL
jgi:hypothetical protein